MKCTQCGGVLVFDEHSRAYAVETFTCSACGAAHYDALRFEPYMVRGVAYTRRGGQNVVMHAVEPSLTHRMDAVAHVILEVFGPRFATPAVVLAVAAAIAKGDEIPRAEFLRGADTAWEAVERLAALAEVKPS